MADGEGRLKVSAVLPWFVSLVFILALVFVLVKQRGGNEGVFETLIRENEILSAMRLNLIRAAEAEKSAVLAVTDEESLKFADQARSASVEVEKERKELTPLIEKDDSAQEKARIKEFDVCWTEFTKLDQLILNLAVQNTNLHAEKLAFTKGAEAVRYLDLNLRKLIEDSSADSAANCKAVKLSYQALVAALKVHDLCTPHIEAETEQEMDAIEKEIAANEMTLSNSLDELGGLVQGKDLEVLKEGKAASDELMMITKEIISLSRENTNIKSLELSLGKKRLITAKCDEILSALQRLVRSRGTKAAR